MNKDPLDISGMHYGANSRVFKNAAKLRAAMTESEIKLWEFLKTKPLGQKFRRQHPIAGYVIYFYCHKLRLSIELDGEYHLSKQQKAKDANRTSYLNDLGITELRYTNKQILEEFEATMVNLLTTLRDGPPFRRCAEPVEVAGERVGNQTNR